jgi:hypothetical protein
MPLSAGLAEGIETVMRQRKDAVFERRSNSSELG